MPAHQIPSHYYREAPDCGTSGLLCSPGQRPTGQSSPPNARPAPIRPAGLDPFVGNTPLEQAKSLLRPVLPYGHYGSPLTSLPEPLGLLLGAKVTLKVDIMKNYLQKNAIKEEDIGGQLSGSLPTVRFFVIHDTSSTLERARSFPRDINEWSWSKNRVDRLDARLTVAHVFVTRVGTSYTAHDFATPYSATKYTITYPQKRNQFIHIELIQPRLRDRRGIDAIAPEPGFPGVQLERLAVAYIAASVRHGEWLIPAFHRIVDMEFGDRAHDDPQNFDLNRWAEKLGGVLKAIHGILPAGDKIDYGLKQWA